MASYRLWRNRKAHKCIPITHTVFFNCSIVAYNTVLVSAVQQSESAIHVHAYKEAEAYNSVNIWIIYSE